MFVLEHASSIDLLTAVMETIKQHIEVWACMDVIKTIALALHTKHQSLKTRGNPNSSVLDLLIEMDQGRYLDQNAREVVLNDRAAYTNVKKSFIYLKHILIFNCRHSNQSSHSRV